MAHSSQCLLHKVCIFPSACQKSVLLISATNQNLENQGAETAAMSRTGNFVRQQWTPLDSRRGVKTTWGRGGSGQWDLSLLCVEGHISVSAYGTVQLHRGEKESLRCPHQLPPSYQCILSFLGTSAEFGMSFPVSPSTSSSHLNVSCVKCSPKTLNPSFLCSVISGVIPKQKATVNYATTVPSCIISKRLTQPERKSRALHGFL